MTNPTFGEKEANVEYVTRYVRSLCRYPRREERKDYFDSGA